VALLVSSEFMAQSELNIAYATAEKYNLKLKTVKISVLNDLQVIKNSKERCYYCKKAIFTRLLAETGGATLCDGSVTDDDDDFRPGKRALAELGVRSPLKECGFSKSMVAEALKELGATELVRPAQSCLATRIATNEPISLNKLQQIEKGEAILREAGLNYFRLRYHHEVARIEVSPSALHESLDRIASISDELKKLGFKHIALDVDGYNKGSMNR
jgi:uncharacterized protein